MPRAVLVALFLLAACRPRLATVRVTITGLDGEETAVPRLTVTFLPYDRDSIVAALEAAASPRPHVGELDSLFALFRPRYQEAARLGGELEAARRHRDSVTAAAGDTAGLGPKITALAARQAEARRLLDSTRSALGPTIDRLRSDVQRWSDSTMSGYPTIVRSLGDRIFANPVADTTSATGWTTAELTGGKWWVTARTIDPADPNREWYWNLRIDRDTVYLNPQTGRNRPRY